jgi:4-hydroxy-tetrahydrodipicolinate reductase
MRLVVIGARGRLGSLIAAAAQRAGVDFAGVNRGDDLAAIIDGGVGSVVVDVATPGATRVHVDICVARKCPLLVATTGLTAGDFSAIAAAKAQIPLLVAANLSPGAHLAAMLSATAAVTLRDADVEVVEVHHRKKKDAPSGTALMLAQAVADARGKARIVKSRDGEALRQVDDIGVVAVRGGDVVGEHSVSFFVDGERLEIVHKVSDRGIFARGAVLAARFLDERHRAGAVGQFQMVDVLRALV